MFCEMCGKQIDDRNRFCPFCGNSTERASSGENTETATYGEESLFSGFDSTALSEDGNIVSVADPSSYSEQAQNFSRSESYSYPVKEGADRMTVKKSSKSIIIVVLIVVLLIGAVFGAFWIITDGELFSSDKFNKKEDTHQADREETTQESTTKGTDVHSSSSDFLSPDTSQQNRTCYVNIESVTLYKGPDVSAYKAICTASRDDALIIKGTHSKYPDWFYVYSQRTNDYGWVSAAFVSDNIITEVPTTDFNSNTEVLYYDVTDRFYVMINVGEGHNLNLRRQPDTTNPDNVILLIPDMSFATVLGVSNRDTSWYYVEYTDEFGTYYGYIHSDHTVRYY